MRVASKPRLAPLNIISTRWMTPAPMNMQTRVRIGTSTIWAMAKPPPSRPENLSIISSWSAGTLSISPRIIASQEALDSQPKRADTVPPTQAASRPKSTARPVWSMRTRAKNFCGLDAGQLPGLEEGGEEAAPARGRRRARGWRRRRRGRRRRRRRERRPAAAGAEAAAGRPRGVAAGGRPAPGAGGGGGAPQVGPASAGGGAAPRARLAGGRRRLRGVGVGEDQLGAAVRTGLAADSGRW